MSGKVKQQFKVEKNIPIPKRSRSGKPGKYEQVIGAMSIGDSILLNNIFYRNHFNKIAKRIGLSTTSRRENDGIRVWIVGYLYSPASIANGDRKVFRDFAVGQSEASRYP